MIRHTSFNGGELRVEMVATARKNPAEMPSLVMTVNGSTLLGHWQQQGVPMGPRLAGVVLHTGPRTFTLSDRIVAAPISTIWAS